MTRFWSGVAEVKKGGTSVMLAHVEDTDPEGGPRLYVVVMKSLAPDFARFTIDRGHDMGFISEPVAEGTLIVGATKVVAARSIIVRAEADGNAAAAAYNCFAMVAPYEGGPLPELETSPASINTRVAQPGGANTMVVLATETPAGLVGLTVHNAGAGNLKVRASPGVAAAPDDWEVSIPVGVTWAPDPVPTGRITGFWDAAGAGGFAKVARRVL